MKQLSQIRRGESMQAYPSSSFSLIWYYWLKKYMSKKNKKSATLQELSVLKQKYRIESIESQSAQNSGSLRKKIQQIRQKTRCNLSVSATTNSTNSLTNPPLFYTINPEQEAKQIEDVLLNESEGIFDQQEVKEMINELHSYYLNSKTIFVIFKLDKEVAIQETVSKLAHSSYNEGSLLNSKINLSSILNEDDSLGDRNDSILESYDKMEDKIDNLELLSKFADLDGMEIWNAKYYSIPHCLVKIKKNCWARTFSDAMGSNPNAILHPSQPKTISSLPIIPKISKHRPSIDKLQAFVSFLKALWEKSPNLHPLCQSIFEYNGLPYIFTQDVREESIAVLCFYVAYGNEEGCLSERSVQRWMEANPTSLLTKTILYMREVVRNRNSHSKQIAIKGLFDQSDIIW